jgi:ATP-dependent HslUV protease, peptidase subunit HslV
MSTVVVVRKNGKACIAADSLISYGSLTQSASYLTYRPKLIQVGSTYIGLVGSTSHEMVLRHYFSRPNKRPAFKDRASIFHTWVELHRALKEEYHLNPNEEKEDPYETTRISALLANPFGIFGVYPLRSVDEYTKFWAMGAGDEFALGAMHACYERLESVEEIAQAGIEAAAEFDNSTALPITLYTVKLK